MELLYKIFLYTHIAAGGTALLSGLVPLSTEKGGKMHRRFGKVFFIAMNFASISAFVLSISKDKNFLLAIACFSFYMNYTGYRALKNRRGRYKWFDWLPMIFSAGAVFYMFYTMDIVLLVFGGILALMIIQDLRNQLKDDEGMRKLVRERVLLHIPRMVGTYIASVTAFLVVNINFVKPGWVLWLLPTVVLTPLIFYWSAVWTKKLRAEI